MAPAGLVALVAADGRRAVALAEAAGADLVAAILDVLMPGHADDAFQATFRITPGTIRSPRPRGRGSGSSRG